MFRRGPRRAASDLICRVLRTTLDERRLAAANGGENVEKVIVIGCGATMDDGYGCPGEWRCLQAAAQGDGEFDGPSQVVSFVKCRCPGRATVSDVGLSMKLSGVKPDKIYLSSCMTRAKPACPNQEIEDLRALLEEKFSVPVVKGTHEYP